MKDQEEYVPDFLKEGETFAKFNPKTVRLTIEETEYGRRYFIETPYTVAADGTIDWEDILDRNFGVHLTAEQAKTVMEDEDYGWMLYPWTKETLEGKDTRVLTEGYYICLPDRGFTNYQPVGNERELLDYVMDMMKDIIAQDKEEE